MSLIFLAGQLPDAGATPRFLQTRSAHCQEGAKVDP
jgi:hypothetical protein